MCISGSHATVLRVSSLKSLVDKSTPMKAFSNMLGLCAPSLSVQRFGLLLPFPQGSRKKRGPSLSRARSVPLMSQLQIDIRPQAGSPAGRNCRRGSGSRLVAGLAPGGRATLEVLPWQGGRQAGAHNQHSHGLTGRIRWATYSLDAAIAPGDHSWPDVTALRLPLRCACSCEC